MLKLFFNDNVITNKKGLQPVSRHVEQPLLGFKTVEQWNKSSQLLRISTRNYDRMTSFERFHQIAGKATPERIWQYKHALLLHKIYNDNENGADWIALNFNQNFNCCVFWPANGCSARRSLVKTEKEIG